MDLFTMLIIPENMNPQSPCSETQWSFVKFVKILKNWLFWSFFAIILALGQKNPKFWHFLNPYTYPNLGQWESRKLCSLIVITLTVLLRPSVMKKFLNVRPHNFEILVPKFKRIKEVLHSEKCNLKVFLVITKFKIQILQQGFASKLFKSDLNEV